MVSVGCDDDVLVSVGCGDDVLVSVGCGDDVLVSVGCGDDVLVSVGCGDDVMCHWAYAYLLWCVLCVDVFMMDTCHLPELSHGGHSSY